MEDVAIHNGWKMSQFTKHKGAPPHSTKEIMIKVMTAALQSGSSCNAPSILVCPSCS